MKPCFRVFDGPSRGGCLLSRGDESLVIDLNGVHQASTSNGNHLELIDEWVCVFGILTLNAKMLLIGVRHVETICTIFGTGHQIFLAKSLAVVKLGGTRAQLLSSSACSETEAEFLTFLNGFSFHFSPDFDFTHSQQRWARLSEPREYDRRFFWNAAASDLFGSKGLSHWVQPVCDSFVGVAEDDRVQYVLISRRSRRRQGTRFLVRGVDLMGNVANFVETEQIVSNKRMAGTMASFVQIRGSMPVCWQQRGDAGELMPLPRLMYSPLCEQGFERHCRELLSLYGQITAVCLVDQHGSEGRVGCAYEAAVRRWNAVYSEAKIRFFWFDFHRECDKRNGGYENLKPLVSRVLDQSQFFMIDGSRMQTHVVRTNCVDNLDRTNVVQVCI